MTQQESIQIKLLAIDSAIKAGFKDKEAILRAKEIHSWLLEQPSTPKIVTL